MTKFSTSASKSPLMRESQRSSGLEGRQDVFIRPETERKAMGWRSRIVAWSSGIICKICCLGSGNPQGSNGTSYGRRDLEFGKPKKRRQYRLLGKNKLQASSNQQIAMYLHWMFRVNFFILFATMCAMFFVLVIICSGFIMISGTLDSDCVRVGAGGYAEYGPGFADAFALSWTTFSTVGYGSTYPALGNQNYNRTNCFLITFICSLESLLGVLYSGFCGAILFGKVLRIQSHAQVTFSDAIVVRYGSGLTGGDDGDDDGSDEDGNDSDNKLPCPILEFRIVNTLFNELGGEIMDANLNVVANVDATDKSDPKISETFRRQSRMDSIREDDTTGNNHRNSNKDSKKRQGSSAMFKLLASFVRNNPGDDFDMDDSTDSEEDGASNSHSTKRIFSKMLIEASDHPFFKRVWLAQHVLDETSPILKPRVRRQIRRNGGAWPERLNSWHALRDSLQFNQILVSLNGVSNVSASDVYAQKIYDFVDVNIGYQFVNILYKDMDGTLKVDTDLINDVHEQKGNGGEPLIVDGENF